MKDTVRYIFQQLFWLLASGARLVASMGVGIKWVFMTMRCMVFAILDLPFFLPNVVWYIFTPNIIRGVSYRSSKRTKLRNLEMIVKREQRDCRSPMRESSPLSASGANASGSGGGDGVGLGSSDTGTGTGSNGNLELSAVGRLVATINPADGSFVDGLPMHLVADLSRQLASNTNSSFDESLAALQRLYQRRQKGEEEQQQHKSEEASPYGSDSFTESDEEDEEDKQNLHNRAKLDIYLPVPLDSLFRFMDQEKKNEDARKAEEEGKKSRKGKSSARLQRKKFPIAISVNGGAWIVGYSFWNFLVARVLAARGYVVFCPDYRNFPQTTMEGMTLDVSDAIAWVLNNAERYNGDLNDVTLIGQSAGAHLTMMSLISQAQQCSYEAAKAASKDGNVSVPAPSNVAYNVPRYNPRESIRTYIGLSGIYNVRGLTRHFDRRGLYRNVLYQIAGGKTEMGRYTVPAYFDEQRRHLTGEYVPDDLFDYMPRQMSFLHGDADNSAPVTESANLSYIIRNAQRDALVRTYQADTAGEAAGAAEAKDGQGDRKKKRPPPSVVEFILVPGASHTDSIIEEPLCCRNSHLVEFLTMYNRADEERRSLMGTDTASPATSTFSNLHRHGRPPSLQLGVSPSDYNSAVAGVALSSVAGGGVGGESGEAGLKSAADEDAEHPIVPVRRPDGILLSPMPAKQRRPLLRLASYICPF